MSDILWAPCSETISDAKITQLQSHIEETYGVQFSGYQQLHQWSIKNPEQFWLSVWHITDIISSQPPNQTVIHPEKLPGAQWFPDAQLNFAENCLRRKDDKPALMFRNERGVRNTLSYKELHLAVAKLAAHLREKGVVAGDRVAGVLHNGQEAVIGMLAAASIGAIWSSCSPDFGTEGIIDRFGQITPKVLIASNGYYYKTKPINISERVASVVANIDSISEVVSVPYLDDSSMELTCSTSLWSEVMQKPEIDINFEQLPFNHPLYILYSSGTTGKPKCILHSAGGTLIQHLKEHQCHLGLSENDIFFYFTTCGWMMWNWLVTGLATQATLVLYDGSPFHPTTPQLFDLIDEEQVTVFGASAKYYAAAEKEGLSPNRTHKLTSLRSMLSTGSPLLPEQYDYLYQSVKKDMHLASISGGTDIVSCFALGNVALPVRRGELQCPGLGMAVEVFNESGESVVEEKGELVCTRSFPSMPIGFWNDEHQKTYHQAYFARFANVWAHGDYAEITKDYGMIIYGRSDATLNPGGVRIGTAEIYRQVDTIAEILESVAVGQRWQGDERIVLFVRLTEGALFDSALETRVRNTIRQKTSPRHVPAKIIAVEDIPKTLSGKIVELAIKKIIHGEPVKNTEALANPESLQLYQNLDELLH